MRIYDQVWERKKKKKKYIKYAHSNYLILVSLRALNISVIYIYIAIIHLWTGAESV